MNGVSGVARIAAAPAASPGPLPRALKNGNIDGVRNSLMEEYINKIVDEFEVRLFMVTLLLSIGFIPLQRYPIHLACSDGHLEIIKLLIDHHCDIECESIHVNNY